LNGVSFGKGVEKNSPAAFAGRLKTINLDIVLSRRTTDEYSQSEQAMVSRSSTSFIKHYKNINFDTLKERHDNFSFGKAIEVKHQVYDTLHFQDLNPNRANMVLLKKTAQPPLDSIGSVVLEKSESYVNRQRLKTSP